MDHLFSTTGVFAHPVTLGATIAVAVALAVTPLVAMALSGAGVLSPETRADAMRRYRTWLFLAPAALVPILLSPASAIALVATLSILSYREYARATGLFRERLLSAIVVLGILAMALAALDHWYGFFVALQPLTLVAILAAGVLADRPEGYLQRVALSAVGFGLFGAGLMHLAYVANDPDYRPILCMLLLATQLGDIAGYCFGKALGRRKLFPRTSPGKTLAGHLGALAVVAPLTAGLGSLLLSGTRAGEPLVLAGLGVLVAIAAQLGDVVLGSIKRDLGVKDLAHVLPGHGGFTDRCNSLLLVAPVAFHYLGYFRGFGLERLPRVLF